MSAIEASSVGVKTMADGTLRITVDIEPRHSQDAFKLFGSPGTPMALAALKTGADTKPEPEPEAPKGGPIAKLAGMWCKDPRFWEWIGADDEKQAAYWVQQMCGITSRAYLDSNEAVAEVFDREVRLPFMAWLKEMNK